MANYRNPKLLAAARDMHCSLQIPGVCTGSGTSTTVAAHANMQMFGKGMGIKAHDYAHCHACAACHTWLDVGPAPKEEKERYFLIAVVRTYGALLESGRLTVTNVR